MSHHNNAKILPALAPCPSRTSRSLMSTAITKSKKNSIACLACKAAKRKCSGSIAPCKACRVANTYCHFDPNKDLRRRVGFKQTIRELEKYKDLLLSLISVLGSNEALEINRILDLIKNKASFEDISLAVGSPGTMFEDPHELSNASRSAMSDSGDQSPDNSGARARQTTSANRIATHSDNLQRSIVSSCTRVSIESLCDIPSSNVSAKPRTASRMMTI